MRYGDGGRRGLAGARRALQELRPAPEPIDDRGDLVARIERCPVGHGSRSRAATISMSSVNIGSARELRPESGRASDRRRAGGGESRVSTRPATKSDGLSSSVARR